MTAVCHLTTINMRNMGRFAALTVLFMVSMKVAMPTGDFIVVKSPNHMKFLENAGPIDRSEIGPMIAAAFGFSLERDLNWNGLLEGNLFKRPKASALISVSGVPAGRLNVKHPVAKYQTSKDASGLNTEYIIERIEENSWKSDPLSVEVSLQGKIFSVLSARSEIFAGLPVSLSALRDDVVADAVDHWFSSSELASLNVSNDPDLAFAGELYMIQQVVNALSGNKNSLKTTSPDVFLFAVDGLNGLAVSYGFDSVQFRDALRLLESVVARVSDQLGSIYKGNILIELVTSSESGVKPSGHRVRRQAETTTSSSNRDKANKAHNASDMYPAMFNIILWFSIVFAIVIFFIAYAIWFMDPGRDSIIYRMTSSRMKRD